MLRRVLNSVLAACILCACAQAQDEPVSISLSKVAVLLRGDSGGQPSVEVEELRYPHQIPWHSDFYVSVELDCSTRVSETVVQVGFDVWMGPQVFGGPDGEVLVKSDADRLGAWFRSSVVAKESADRVQECPSRVLLGPFQLMNLVPGPRGSKASLWPTRLRVSVQVIAAGVLVKDVRHARLEKVISVR